MHSLKLKRKLWAPKQHVSPCVSSNSFDVSSVRSSTAWNLFPPSATLPGLKVWSPPFGEASPHEEAGRSWFRSNCLSWTFQSMPHGKEWDTRKFRKPCVFWKPDNCQTSHDKIQAVESETESHWVAARMLLQRHDMARHRSQQHNTLISSYSIWYDVFRWNLGWKLDELSQCKIDHNRFSPFTRQTQMLQDIWRSPLQLQQKGGPLLDLHFLCIRFLRHGTTLSQHQLQEMSWSIRKNS